MNVTKQQYTVSSSVVLIHTGVLAWYRAATAPCTVSVGWSVYTMCLHIHLPVFVDILHGRHRETRVAPVVHVVLGWVQLLIMHMSTSIYQNTRSISGCTWISGTRVRQMRGKWYIDTDIDRYIPLFRARGPLSWSMWGSLRLAPIMHVCLVFYFSSPPLSLAYTSLCIMGLQ